MKTLPPRWVVSHSSVAPSGSAATISRAMAPATPLVCSYVWPGATGTKICTPVAPDVFGYPLSPSESSAARTWRPTAAASAKPDGGIGSRSKTIQSGSS